MLWDVFFSGFARFIVMLCYSFVFPFVNLLESCHVSGFSRVFPYGRRSLSYLYRAVSFVATTLDRFIALFHWIFPAAPRYVFT